MRQGDRGRWAADIRKLTCPNINPAHIAADAIAQLEHGHTLLLSDLAGLRDADLDRPRLTNRGEQCPTRALRDLYRLRSAQK